MIRFLTSFSGLGTIELKSLLFMIFSVLVANIGLYLFNRVSGGMREGNNALAGIFFATVSVLYSLILTFVIIAEWDSFNGLDRTIASEGAKLNSILAHSSNLPDTLKATIGKSLSDYCQQVINQEWVMQKSSHTDHPSAIPSLRHLLLTTDPANKIQENVLKVIDDDLSAISDLRRDRLSHTHTQLPPLIWRILEAGAVMLIIFCYFFNAPSVRLQKVYLSFFVCLLAMCLSIVYNLDHPFLPDSGLDSSPYQKVLSEMPAYYSDGKRIAHLSY